jgi:hypothetical protein
MRANIHESFWWFSGALIVVAVFCLLMQYYWTKQSKKAKFQERIAHVQARLLYWSTSETYALHGVTVMALYGTFALLYR